MTSSATHGDVTAVAGRGARGGVGPRRPKPRPAVRRAPRDNAGGVLFSDAAADRNGAAGALLERHGTQLVVLKPASVVEAAAADLRRRWQKQDGRSAQFEPYAFHRAHVRVAANIADLIGRAIAGRSLGGGSGKRVTRLLYGDAALLQAALAEAT